MTLQALISEVKSQIGERGRNGQNSVAQEIAEIRKSWLDEWTPLLDSDEVPIGA